MISTYLELYIRKLFRKTMIKRGSFVLPFQFKHRLDSQSAPGSRYEYTHRLHQNLSKTLEYSSDRYNFLIESAEIKTNSIQTLIAQGNNRSLLSLDIYSLTTWTIIDRSPAELLSETYTAGRYNFRLDQYNRQCFSITLRLNKLWCDSLLPI